MPSPGFFFRYSVSSAIEWIGFFASTAIAKLSLASVVTGVKSLTGSKESCLKMCPAAASVELAGVDRTDLARRILLRADGLRRQHERGRDKSNPDCASGRMCHFFPPDWFDDSLTGPFLGRAK